MCCICFATLRFVGWILDVDNILRKLDGLGDLKPTFALNLEFFSLQPLARYFFLCDLTVVTVCSFFVKGQEPSRRE